MTKVPNASAAPAQKPGERSRLWHGMQRFAGVVDALRKGRTHVRRAQRDDMPDVPDPFGPLLARLITGATADEPAHRVSDQRQLIDLNGPCVNEVRDQFPKRVAVLGYVTPGVVADEDRRSAEIALEARPVALPARTAAPPPWELGAHQPVNEHHDAPVRGGERRREPACLARHGEPIDPHRHRLLEDALLPLERVADQTVDRSQSEPTPRRRR